mgnify:FL=1
MQPQSETRGHDRRGDRPPYRQALRPASGGYREEIRPQNPIFEATASYGHFGNRPYTRKEKVWEDGREVEREIEFFGWEKLDAVDLIKQEFGL